jgi:hypothetical protein
LFYFNFANGLVLLEIFVLRGFALNLHVQDNFLRHVWKLERRADFVLYV